MVSVTVVEGRERRLNYERTWITRGFYNPKDLSMYRFGRSLFFTVSFVMRQVPPRVMGGRDPVERDENFPVMWLGKMLWRLSMRRRQGRDKQTVSRVMSFVPAMTRASYCLGFVIEIV